MSIEFEIKRTSRGYVVIRKNGEYNQHSHHNTLQACKDLIRLIQLNKMPKSKYFRGSVKRLLTQEEYNRLKPCKQIYYNINKGVR